MTRGKGGRDKLTEEEVNTKASNRAILEKLHIYSAVPGAFVGIPKYQIYITCIVIKYKEISTKLVKLVRV